MVRTEVIPQMVDILMVEIPADIPAVGITNVRVGMNTPRSKLRGITLASPKSVLRHSSPLQTVEYSAVDAITLLN
jgi:hypothetical protein